MDWQEPNNDSLDELLRSAQWSEIEPQRISSATQRWRQIRSRQRIIEHVKIASAIGAAILLVAGVISWRTADVESPPDFVVDAAPSKHPDSVPEAILETVPEQLAADRAATASEVATPTVTAREANTYELAIVRRHRRVRSDEQHQQVQAPAVESMLDPFEETIVRLSATPGPDLVAAAKELHDSHPNAERQLQRLASHPRSAKSMIAVRMLAHLATRRSLMLLVDHSLQARCPDEVFAALERLCEIDELAELAYRASNSTRRQAWIAALLRRDPVECTPVYLALLRNPVTVEDAVVALSAAENPPIEGLFAALGSPDGDERMAAARALAARNDPAVSARLARIVMNNNTRREVLVALLMSKDEVASEFLAYARTDLRLWPAVQAVSAQMNAGFRLN